MKKILWGMQEYAYEIIKNAPFAFDYIVKDEYSEEMDAFAKLPIYTEEKCIQDTSRKYILISDVFHYQDISRKLCGYGLREAFDFSGGFEYLDLDKYIKKSGMKARTWKEKNDLFPFWRCRVKQMADYIEQTDHSILDLGCGEEYLKKLIDTNTIRYIPCDYVKRDDDTEIFDFDQYEFPAIAVDVIFISGCLEYLKDPEWLIQRCAMFGKKIIISYAPLEFLPNIELRRRYGYANHYSICQFMDIFRQNHFQLSDVIRGLTKDLIFIFQSPDGGKGEQNENIQRIITGQSDG